MTNKITEEVKFEALELIYTFIGNRAKTAMIRFQKENNLDKQFINTSAAAEVTDELLKPATQDFLKDYSKSNDGNLNAQVKVYVDENYDNDYIFQQIEQHENVAEIKLEMVECLVSFLRKTAPYSKIKDDKVWRVQAEKIPLNELNDYLSEEGISAFVTKYVPNWDN